MTRVPFKVRAEVAFTSAPLAASPAWQDISNYVLLGNGSKVEIGYGRGDEFASVQPATLSLLLDNTDGRFTPGLSTSPYYPNVKKGRRIRVTIRPWDLTTDLPTNPGNSISNPGAEVNTTGWAGTNITLARTTVAGEFRSGVAAFKYTITSSSVASYMQQASGLVPVVAGRVYSMGCYAKKSGTSRPMKMHVSWADADGVEVSSATGSATTITSAGFTRLVLENQAAPVGAVYARVRPLIEAANAVSAEVWYVDDVMLDEGATLAAHTTTAPDIYHRFDGFVDRWPQQWIGSAATYAEARLTATDRLARLGRLANLSTVIEVEYRSDEPAYYWTLGDPGVATQALPLIGDTALGVAQIGSGGTLVFAGATGPGTDGYGAPLFTRADADNGKVLRANLPITVGFGQSQTVEFFFASSSDGVLFHAGQLLEDRDNGLVIWLTGGRVHAFTAFSGGNQLDSISASLNNGAIHHVAVVANDDDSTVKLYIDGVENDSVSDGLSDFDWIALGGLGLGTAPPAESYHLYTGSLAHLALHDAALPAARILEHYEAGIDAFEGESTGDRVARIAGYIGVVATDIDAGSTTSMTALESEGKSPVTLFREIEITEDGIIFFDREGQLTFHGRSRRFNAAPGVILDCSAGEVADSLTFIEDDFGMANDVTFTKPDDDISVHVQDSDSINEFDRYVKTETIHTTDLNELSDRAYSAVNRYGTPSQRCPQIEVDLGTQSSLIAEVAALDISSLIRLTNLPVQAPADTFDLFVEGYAEQLSLEGWAIVFNCSPSDQIEVWVLDSADYSQLDESTNLAF